ncbi:MAG: SDR family NAD(P)-dependent oxidoreductase, partial [Pseudomonadota bacterium]|nr:SDR family NAD(P)-dependent oxidoreductase [Pseudomonadota bacterium]
MTGGASGIGLGLAKALLARGGQVVLADINIARAEAMAEELGPKACAAAVDVRSTDS